MSQTVHFEKSLGAVVCRPCASGVVVDTPNSINNHFRASPHYFKGPTLRFIHDQVVEWPTKSSSDVIFPGRDKSPIPAVPYLKIHSGWFCKHCLQWLSTNLEASKRHLREEHNLHRGKEDRDLGPCRLQTVYRDRKLVRWFRVTEPEAHNAEDDTSSTPLVANSINDFVSSQLNTLSQIDEQEKIQASTVQDSSDHKSSVIPWVRSCGFDRHLRGLDKKKIRRSWRKVEDDEPDTILVQRLVVTVKEILEETWQRCVDEPRCRLTRPIAVILSQF